MNKVTVRFPEYDPELTYLYVNKNRSDINDVYILAYVNGWVAVGLCHGAKWTEPKSDPIDAVEGLEFISSRDHIRIE